MAVTGRYHFAPMTSRRLTMRVTLKDRIIAWLYLKRHTEKPDVFTVTGYHAPTIPSRTRLWRE